MFSRECQITSLALTTSSSTSPGFNFKGCAGGQVYVPAGSSITGLNWYGSPDGVTWTAVYDGAGTASTSTIAAGQNCLIPAACFANAFLMAVASGGAGTVTISLKS